MIVSISKMICDGSNKNLLQFSNHPSPLKVMERLGDPWFIMALMAVRAVVMDQDKKKLSGLTLVLPRKSTGSRGTK
jgi:hypothetical protein